MKFSIWFENRILLEGSKKKGPKPNHMPEPTSNVIKPSRMPKQRQPKGRQDTTFRGRPPSRADQQRRALEDQ
jgi:hypothetical protein